MNLSFNSDDLDLIKEIESINNIEIDNDQQNITSTPKDNETSKNNPKANNQKSQRRKRRSPTKINFTPKLDLDALLGPSDITQNNDNNDFLNLSPRNEEIFFSPKEPPGISNSSISLLESRVTNYASKAFHKLKKDLIYEFKLLLEDDFHLQNIIYNFLMSLLSEIRNQIRFSNESTEFPYLDMNFDLDLNSLSIPKNSINSNFQIHPIIEQISEMKSSFTQNIKKTQISLNQEIQSRDSELSSTSQTKKSKYQYIEQLNQKYNQLQKEILELQFSIELFKKYNALTRQKLEDFELIESLHQQKMDNILLIQKNLEHLQDDLKKINLDKENKRLLIKIKQIIDEKNDIQQTSNWICTNIKHFLDLSNALLYNASI